MPPDTLGEFLTWLSTAGGFTAFMTLGLEHLWPNWDEYPKERKQFIALTVAILLGVVSAAFTTWFPNGIWPNAESLYRVVFNAVTIVVGSQFLHMVIKPKPDNVITVTSSTTTSGSSGSVSMPSVWVSPDKPTGDGVVTSSSTTTLTTTASDGTVVATETPITLTATGPIEDTP